MQSFIYSRKYVNGRGILNPTASSLKTVQSFKGQQGEEHHLGTSSSVNLIVRIVSQYPIDSMHNCLGIAIKIQSSSM